jgi:effector-binding domain-containing protein
MSTEPKLEYRAAQHFVAIRAQVVRQELGALLPPLFGEVLAWLEKKGVAPVGPPFVRYLIVDPEMKMRQIQLEVGVPVGAELPGNGRVFAALLPAGCYAVFLHTGPYDGLRDATSQLLAWAEDSGISWRRSHDGKLWDARIESYVANPVQQPDPEKWRTELAILVEDKDAPTA